MKAMILAAGEGTRLSPLTLQTPKVLLPLNGVPLIQYTLAWLRRYGVTEVAINLHHLGEKIKDFLGDGSRFGVKIVYSPEKALLGTAGGVKRLAHFLDDTFAVVYGDVVPDFDLSAMIEFHREKRAVATLALVEVPNPWEVGIVEIDKDGQLVNFMEKPPRGTELGNLGSGGVYVLEEEVLSYIPSEGFCDFAYEIFPKIITLGLPVYGYRLKPDDYLGDIGTLEKYHQINQHCASGRVTLNYAE
jgi:NDP-sugar pyrophosphorylase family protein